MSEARRTTIDAGEVERFSALAAEFHHDARHGCDSSPRYDPMRDTPGTNKLERPCEKDTISAVQ